MKKNLGIEAASGIYINSLQSIVLISFCKFISNSAVFLKINAL